MDIDKTVKRLNKALIEADKQIKLAERSGRLLDANTSLMDELYDARLAIKRVLNAFGVGRFKSKAECK